jgi:hypothetical protein
MDEATIVRVWRIACAVAAVYLAWNGQWLPAGVFALAAK